MWRRGQAITIGILCVLSAAGMVACGGVPAASVSPTNTVAPTATSTPPATATSPTGATQTDFTCPTTKSGSTTTFRDAQSGLSFSYTSAWTEQQCTRIDGGNGVETLLIGNLFSVSVFPRGGQTAQEYVNATKDANESVTLTPFTAAHAVAAYAVADTIGANPQAEEPFAQTLAIVEGSQSFYQVNEFIAQMSISDTMPGVYGSKMVRQVVSTFAVN